MKDRHERFMPATARPPRAALSGAWRSAGQYTHGGDSVSELRVMAPGEVGAAVELTEADLPTFGAGLRQALRAGL